MLRCESPLPVHRPAVVQGSIGQAQQARPRLRSGNADADRAIQLQHAVQGCCRIQEVQHVLRRALALRTAAEFLERAAAKPLERPEAQNGTPRGPPPYPLAAPRERHHHIAKGTPR